MRNQLVWKEEKGRDIFKMKSLLKFITCGSVDDGKSTLIGHMLYDAKLIFADQKRALEMDSKIGSTGGELDYSLLLDGLMAEREQGITIDVAYRYFTTEKRSFIVADTPGHEEYTRNMAVGASFAELAILLIDASAGVMVQTKRHLRICALMGIRDFVFVVNKMDLTGYDKNVYDRIKRDIEELAEDIKTESLYIIPVSATKGDNITNPSENMKWFDGSPLLSYLEEIEIEDNSGEGGFVMPVQRVCRPNYSFRGFQGQVERGSISTGDEIVSYPSGEKASVKELYICDKKTDSAVAGQPLTIVIDREMDISRGCVIVSERKVSVNNLFKGKMLWLDDEPLKMGKSYYLKVGTKKVPASVIRIRHKVDVNTGSHIACDTLVKNEIGVVEVMLAEKTVFAPFDDIREIGCFILIDSESNMTSACGVVEHELRRGQNVVWQDMDVTRELREQKLGQQARTVWFTGLSGAGKSTLANALEKRLIMMGRHTMILDGDNVRHGLNNNLGFTDSDRSENIRRIAEASKLLNDAGIIVMVSCIAPYDRDRRNAKKIIGDSFREIYVSTSIEECEKRDVKGLYDKARKNEIPNFTGVSSEYQIPDCADLVIDTEGRDVEECVDEIMDKLGL